MALKRIFQGNIDEITQSQTNTSNPLLEKFLQKYGSNFENISLHIAHILASRDEKFFKKILSETTEI